MSMQASDVTPNPKPTKRGKGSPPTKAVQELLLRDGYRCARCGMCKHLEVHHKLPKGRGGTHEVSNLAMLCAKCHRYVHRNPAKAKEEGWTE